jgi:Transposase DDE domain group 1
MVGHRRCGHCRIPAFAATLPEPVKQWSLTSLKEKLIKIGARVVRHGHYVIFQMAEVAVPKELFQEILRLIDGLRPRPDPA